MSTTVAAGVTLTATYKKQVYTCDVVEANGGLRYRYGGVDYTSPSAAGKAVTGGSCNGLRFWGIAAGAPTAPATKVPRGLRVTKALKERMAQAEPAPKPVKPRGPRVIHVIKRARKLPSMYDCFPTKKAGPNEEVFTCSDCLNTFVGPRGKIPDTCPQGHPATAIDDFTDVPVVEEEE